MPTASEQNTFRRYVGDYGKNTITNGDIDAYLDDATFEVTSDFATPVTDFDVLIVQYHPEVILLAAINWWWQRAAQLTEHHTQSIGQGTQNASEKWDRAMQMIEKLEDKYLLIQQLGIDITIGNLSRWSKSSLMRLGGNSEENILADA